MGLTIKEDRQKKVANLARSHSPAQLSASGKKQELSSHGVKNNTSPDQARSAAKALSLKTGLAILHETLPGYDTMAWTTTQMRGIADDFLRSQGQELSNDSQQETPTQEQEVERNQEVARSKEQKDKELYQKMQKMADMVDEITPNDEKSPDDSLGDYLSGIKDSILNSSMVRSVTCFISNIFGGNRAENHDSDNHDSENHNHDNESRASAEESTRSNAESASTSRTEQHQTQTESIQAFLDRAKTRFEQQLEKGNLSPEEIKSLTEDFHKRYSEIYSHLEARTNRVGHFANDPAKALSDAERRELNNSCHCTLEEAEHCIRKNVEEVLENTEQYASGNKTEEEFQEDNASSLDNLEERLLATDQQFVERTEAIIQSDELRAELHEILVHGQNQFANSLARSREGLEVLLSDRAQRALSYQWTTRLGPHQEHDGFFLAETAQYLSKSIFNTLGDEPEQSQVFTTNDSQEEKSFTEQKVPESFQPLIKNPLEEVILRAPLQRTERDTKRELREKHGKETLLATPGAADHLEALAAAMLSKTGEHKA